MACVGPAEYGIPLKGFKGAPLKNGKEEIAAANHPRMRLLLVEHAQSDSPLSDVHGEWTDCTPETAANFSAVAYFFGREISQRENVPVGLIDSTWGGTPARSWISLGALGSVYGEKVAYASPEFREATMEGNAIRVWFTHGRGLNARGKPVGGFEVAGEDRVFVPADAKIEEIDGQSTEVASSPSVAKPRYVRYGWANVVTDFLYNNAGLPLGTFTSQ